MRYTPVREKKTNNLVFVTNSEQGAKKEGWSIWTCFWTQPCSLASLAHAYVWEKHGHMGIPAFVTPTAAYPWLSWLEGALVIRAELTCMTAGRLGITTQLRRNNRKPGQTTRA
jgi:hypothetical protein